MEDYFKIVEEESIKNNFVIIYELLDECIDNGIIQTVDPLVQKEYIKTSYKELIKPLNKLSKAYESPEIGKIITWRAEGIKYKTNEIFIDVIEKLNLILSSNGVVTKSEIIGTVEVNSKLSGMPIVEVCLSQNSTSFNKISTIDKLSFDDVKFHKCVDLCDYDNKKTIKFTPPDGKFDLMTYIISTPLKPIFTLIVDRNLIKDTRLEQTIIVASNFKANSQALNIEIKIPVPCDLIKWDAKAPVGKLVYISSENILLWTISSFRGMQNYSLKMQITMPSVVSSKFKRGQGKLYTRTL